MLDLFHPLCLNLKQNQTKRKPSATPGKHWSFREPGKKAEIQFTAKTANTLEISFPFILFN